MNGESVPSCGIVGLGILTRQIKGYSVENETHK